MNRSPVADVSQDVRHAGVSMFQNPTGRKAIAACVRASVIREAPDDGRHGIGSSRRRNASVLPRRVMCVRCVVNRLANACPREGTASSSRAFP